MPQGSILGPLLFFVYINDISAAVQCKLLLYADDSALLVPGCNTLCIKLDSVNLVWYKKEVGKIKYFKGDV